MSTANQHDTHDPNSLLYYAPRRLRDGAKTLRSIRPRPEDGAQSIPIAFLERTQDTAPPPSPFPETLRSLESEAIIRRPRILPSPTLTRRSMNRYRWK